MSRLYANNAVGTLLNAALTTDTTLTLQAGQGVKFPTITAGNTFLMTLIGLTSGVESSWEIVSVTARATDVLTVVRAQEGTVAAAWAIGTGAELRFTAGAAQATSAKDDTGGYAGLTLFSINFKNALNTFTSLFSNTNTAARTYTFPDRTGTIADNTDLATKLNLAGGTLTGALNYAPINAIASAATTNLAAATSNAISITGSVTITALGTLAAGAERAVTFAAALTLTHNAVSLILPGAANILTAANDTAYFISQGAGNWLCTGYQRASGAGLTGAGLTDVFVTAITQTATAGNYYWLKNAALTAVTLPASPIEGNAAIGVKAANGLTTNTIDPGANTIEGQAGVLTINNLAVPVVLQFVNGSWRFK